MKRLVFDLTKITFLKRLISMYYLVFEALSEQNLFTESNLDDWFSSYVQFFFKWSFIERAAAAL